MKKLIYFEHLILLLLVGYLIRGCIKVQAFKRQYSKTNVINNANAYFSEVSFWGNDRFFKEIRPIVNNGYQDVTITPGMLVYTSEQISNKQCRVWLSLKEDKDNNGRYLLQVGTYNFEYGNSYSELAGKSFPLEFTISTNGVSFPQNYTMSISGTDGTHDYFPVCVTPACNQPKGAYMAYMYIGNPGSKFTPQDFHDFGTSPETFPSERLNGKLFRIIWNYSEWEDIKSDR